MENQVHQAEDSETESHDQKAQKSHYSYPSFDRKTVEMDHTFLTYHKGSDSKAEITDTETEVLSDTPQKMYPSPSSLSEVVETLPADPEKTLPALLGQDHVHPAYKECLSVQGLGG